MSHLTLLLGSISFLFVFVFFLLVAVQSISVNPCDFFQTLALFDTCFCFSHIGPSHRDRVCITLEPAQLLKGDIMVGS